MGAFDRVWTQNWAIYKSDILPDAPVLLQILILSDLN